MTGSKFQGSWVNGERHGYGKLTHADGHCYEGQWENGKKNGKGDLIIFADPAFYSNKDWTPAISERYKGIFKENELDGQIKQFDDISKKWFLKNYKNGLVKN